MVSTIGRYKPAIALAVSAVCFWALSQQVSSVTWDTIWPAVQSISAWQWAVALIATAFSFLAIGEYDVLWHRHLKTGVPDRRARVTGMSSVAVAQTVGLGTVTGAFLRWHMLDPLPFRQAVGVTLGVCIAFLSCWAVLGVLAAVWVGTLPGLPVIALIMAAAGLLRMSKVSAKFSGYLSVAPKVMGLTILDLAFASVALWVLIPDPSLISYPTLLAAFTLALGAGLISNAPGGLGAFELVLIATLPKGVESDLIAAMLAFRLVYYLIPAVCGGLVLLASHLRSANPDASLSDAPNSDLCWQGAAMMSDGQNTFVGRRHLLGTVALEPTSWNFSCAQHPFVFKYLYKCTQDTATKARRNGWAVRRIASDAVIDPQTWSTDGPAHSTLRRKLRQAAKAGVTVDRAGHAAPDPAMDIVANAWKTRQGGELGYAMGRYTPDYVARQHTYQVHQHGCLVGFITVQTRRSAWTIDLIRHLPELPQGAMHAAIATIIADAATAGVSTLSLGAVPDGPSTSPIQRYCNRKKAGLRQFKAAFNPRWEPRYHAAPTPLHLGLSLVLIMIHIQRPWARIGATRAKLQTKLMNVPKIIHLPHV